MYFKLHYETVLSPLLLRKKKNVVCVVSELDQHLADFKGGSFPLSIVSSYRKKKGDSGAWRKVNTSPRKKPAHFSSPTWNKPDRKQEGSGREACMTQFPNARGLSFLKLNFVKALSSSVHTLTE